MKKFVDNYLLHVFDKNLYSWMPNQFTLENVIIPRNEGSYWTE